MPDYGVSEVPRRDLPLDQIQEMQQQGLTNNQIIQALQRDGYTTSQIFDALNQMNMTPANMSPPRMAPPAPAPATASPEELIEAIINEKWNELVRDINKIVAWKEAANDQMNKFQQRLDDLKAEFDKLHQAVIAKVGEYDKNILQVGAEVKAMEKVFSKVLPIFTENVAELSKITETMKKKSPSPGQ